MATKRPAHFPQTGPAPEGPWASFDPIDDGLVLVTTACKLRLDGFGEDVIPDALRAAPSRWFFVGESEDEPFSACLAEGYETEAEADSAARTWAAKQWHICAECDGKGWIHTAGPWGPTPCPECAGTRYVAWGEPAWGRDLEDQIESEWPADLV